jgi:ABC-type glutathione transport system ATPase component
MTAPLLAVSDLGVGFAIDRGVVEVIEGLSFSVAAGRTLAIVGESGCGKSVTSLALMRLLPPNARVRGRAVFDGIDLFAASEAEMRALRGGAIAMIF